MPRGSRATYLGLLLLMVGEAACAAPTPFLPLDGNAISALHAKTIALVIPAPPTFQLYGSDLPRGSVVGDISAMVEGSKHDKLVAEIEANDPSVQMGERIVAA